MNDTVYVTHATMKSPVGPITVSCTERGVFSVDFDNGAKLSQREQLGECQLCDMRMPFAVIDELSAYFAGELTKFSVPLDLKGTEFQLQVWELLCEIPFGETVTYGEMARRLNRETAYRAVGHANSKNPISIIVPCHRVVAQNGLGGYAGGLDAKEWLINFEQQCVREDLNDIALSLMEMIEDRLEQLGFSPIVVEKEEQKKKKEGKVLHISDYLNRIN